MSKTLQPAELNYDIYDKELLAVVGAFKTWRVYLEGCPKVVIVLTDHKNLETFTKTKELSRRQARWSEFLSRFNFEIHYRQGSAAGKPDALSRRPQDKPETGGKPSGKLLDPSQFKIASTDFLKQPVASDRTIVERIKAAYAMDHSLAPFTIPLTTAKPNQLTELTKHLTLYQWDEGLLLKDGLVVVPNDEVLRRDITKSRHDAKSVGHPGQAKTMELLTRDFWWPHMRKWVNRYVNGCETCKRTKPVTTARHGLLAPIPVPGRPWSEITYDLITELPPSKGFTAILVVVDRFTKMAHFVPTFNELSAEGTADLFLKEVWSKHGLPQVTISDRGTQFNNKFTRRLYTLLGVEPRFSTVYHPQTDGQTERVNQVVEHYLRTYTTYLQDNWSDLLPLAEFAYNNAESASTGLSPFFANYGFHPQLSQKTWSDSLVPAAEDYTSKLKDTHAELVAQLGLANKQYEKSYNRKHAAAPRFTKGQKVWLRPDNIKTLRPAKKLDHKLLGPFKIDEVLSPLTVRLALPTSMKIHPVFHVNLVIPAESDTIPGRTQPPPPPVLTEGPEEEYEIEGVLQSRRFGRGRKYQYLVQWKGYGPSENSWVDAGDMEHAKELVHEFHQKWPLAPKPKTGVKEGVMS